MLVDKHRLYSVKCTVDSPLKSPTNQAFWDADSPCVRGTVTDEVGEFCAQCMRFSQVVSHDGARRHDVEIGACASLSASTMRVETVSDSAAPLKCALSIASICRAHFWTARAVRRA